MGSFLVPVAFFSMIAAIVIVPQILRYRERARLHETLRRAYENGQPVPPELITALQSGAPAKDQVFDRPDRSARDLRTGIIWLSIGLGLIAIGAAFYAALYYDGGAAETFAGFVAAGAIPAFIGAAFMLLSFLGKPRR